MTIKDCLDYKTKNLQEEDVMKVIQEYPLTDYVRQNTELFDDILWLLNERELTYIHPFKQKDHRTPNLIECFNQFGITLVGREGFVKVRNFERPSMKITLEVK